MNNVNAKGYSQTNVSIRYACSLAFVLIVLFLLPTCAFADVRLDATNFPDPVFRQYVCDRTGVAEGNMLTSQQANGITAIDVSNQGVTSLQGIENFLKLTSLDCSYNYMPLDVSANTALTYLDCSHNNISTLNLSANTALTYLNCSHNNLAPLDVSNNTALNKLICQENGLDHLNLSANTALAQLDCQNNFLTSLDLSANRALTHLFCHSNDLTTLDVSANPKLKFLMCIGNQLTSINTGRNNELERLVILDNSLTSIDVSGNPNLTEIACSTNNLTSLDVSHNPTLRALRCSDNHLKTLDVSANRELLTLDCSNNELSSLDLNNNPNISNLNCANNACEIQVLSTGEFSLMLLPQFHGAKASNWTNATYHAVGNKLTGIQIGNTITYNYDCGNGHVIPFRLYTTPRMATVAIQTSPAGLPSSVVVTDINGNPVSGSGGVYTLPRGELYNYTASSSMGTKTGTFHTNMDEMLLTIAFDKATVAQTVTDVATIEGNFDPETRAALNTLIHYAQVEIQNAISAADQSSLLAMAGVTANQLSNVDNTITLDIQVKINLVSAVIDHGAGMNHMKYTFTPVAKVKVNDQYMQHSVNIPNSMFSAGIRVNLPTATIHPTMLVHDWDTGSTTYRVGQFSFNPNTMIASVSIPHFSSITIYDKEAPTPTAPKTGDDRPIHWLLLIGLLVLSVIMIMCLKYISPAITAKKES